jgi:hypothetical protein
LIDECVRQYEESGRKSPRPDIHEIAWSNADLKNDMDHYLIAIDFAKTKRG